MLQKLLQDPALPEITLVLAVLVAIALWQKLNRAAQAMGVVYVIYLLYVLIIPGKETIHAYRSEAPMKVEETVFPDEIPEEAVPPPATPPPIVEERIPTIEATKGEEKAQDVSSTKAERAVTVPDAYQAVAADYSPLVLNSMVTCQAVENRQPVEVDSVFSLDQERVYCVTGIRNLNTSARVYHKWYFNGKLRGTVPITLGWSHNWRAWSYATLRPGTIGQWRVEVEDSLGQVLGSRSFTVVPADSL